MSVEMDAIDPSGDIAHYDQEYPLDLNDGTEVTDIDFQLGAEETEAQFQLPGTGSSALAKQSAEPETTLDHDALNDLDDGQMLHNPEHDVNGDIGMEYGDEIGYEDDDAPDDDGINGAATEGTDASHPQTVADGSRPGSETHETGDDDFAYDGVDGDASEHYDHDDQETGNDAPVMNDGALNLPHSPKADSHAAFQDEEQEPSELVASVSERAQVDEDFGDTSDVPYVEVVYNEAQYSLFGTPDDDPDSFFLSEPEHFDLPLSDFLVALRHVVEDEVSPHDELSIRIPSLSLEFSERSHESFLCDHNLREIHDCWLRLLHDDTDETSFMAFHLIVRPDPERRLMELHTQSNMNNSLLVPGVTTTNPAGQEATNYDNAEDESPANEYAEDSQNSAGHGSTAGDATGDSAGLAPSESLEASEYPVQEDNHVEEDVEETYPEAYDFEDEVEAEAEDFDGAGEDGVVEFAEASDDVPDVTNDPAPETTLAEASAIETVLESTTNEIAIEFGEDLTIMPDGEDGQEHSGYDYETNAGHAQGQASGHTSATSTVDGDEIDYEDRPAAANGFELENENDQEGHDVEPLDEIDWRNDEDEVEEEAAAIPATQSPSSVSVKRSRADEAENLVEEADHKRRRT